MRYFILIFFLSINITSNAQLSVDIGADTTFCRGLRLHQPDTSFLGSNVFVSGGTEPYTYSWSCEFELSETIKKYASDFLNDTAILNPYFITTSGNNEPVIFTLRVQDALGNTASDSIEIKFSRFGYSLAYYELTIKKGDSAKFSGSAFIGGGIEPLFFSWYPSKFLSDSTDLATYAFPDSTTEYSLYAIDAIGCKSDTMPFYKIIVDNTSRIESINENNEFFNLINRHNEVIIRCKDYWLIDKKKYISVYTTSGKILISDLFTNQEYIISKVNLGEIVIINISFKNKSLFNSKVLL